jgi:hypothetical protein
LLIVALLRSRILIEVDVKPPQICKVVGAEEWWARKHLVQQTNDLVSRKMNVMYVSDILIQVYSWNQVMWVLTVTHSWYLSE